MPPEPNAKCGQLGDLELARLEASTGNPSIRSHSALDYMLGAALECNLAHYEVDPHRLQPESHHRGYGRNYSSST